MSLPAARPGASIRAESQIDGKMVVCSFILVGGLKHFYFPFHIWDVILPIDFNSIIFQDLVFSLFFHPNLLRSLGFHFLLKA